MRNKIVTIVIIVVVIGLGVWFLGGKGGSNPEGDSGVDTTPPEKDAMEAVMEFYAPWLEAVQSTTTDPYQSDLLEHPMLSQAVRDALKMSQNDETKTVDPVLCQSTVPERVGTKIIYDQPTGAEVMVLARTGAERSTQQAVVTLQGVKGEWQIVEIRCTAAESAPEKEFSFEQEGYLLKDSLPDTMQKEYWHLVYEQQGQSGYTVPLFFDEESTCIDLDGGEVVCKPDSFQEASHVFAQGQMLEAGLTVKRLHAMPTE